jgi:hypothetical protein
VTQPANHSVSTEARDAWMLDDLIASTTPPGETAAAGDARRAVIREMFRDLAPASAEQAMAACHLIAMRFVLNAILRDALDATLDPRLRARARSLEVSASRGLRAWMRTGVDAYI